VSFFATYDPISSYIQTEAACSSENLKQCNFQDRWLEPQLDVFSCVRTDTKATVSFFMPSVCPHVSRRRISVIFDIGDFYANLSRKFKFGCSRIKYRELYVEDYSMFHCYRGHYIKLRALSSSTMVPRCSFRCEGINIVRTLYTVNLYVHCLFCFTEYYEPEECKYS
jgi:hypothetical protein